MRNINSLIRIMDLAHFSRVMLKSDSILLPLIAQYIDTFNDIWIHCRYLMLRLSGSRPPLLPSEADAGIAKSTTGHFSDMDKGRQVQFFKSVVAYYLRIGDPIKALKFNEIAMSVMDGETQEEQNRLPHAFVYLDAGLIAQQNGQYQRAIYSARKGRIEARKAGSVLTELDCLVLEADTLTSLGNLSHALELCEAAQNLAVASGLQSSDREIAIWDITAEVAFQKSQYDKAYRLYQLIAENTSSAKSPHFHIHASLWLIEIEIFLGQAGHGTGKKIDLSEGHVGKSPVEARDTLCKIVGGQS
ncbi:hypothetical protein MVEN_00147700 [Mycena venus]|uniref:Uncharacterized protein n=1 Tax=Mycena venus TaxID=2733690 RepID=A0A8H6YW97_9AGAR|nr:hypothetical protein MVEN_00147700 [Mycena venus]